MCLFFLFALVLVLRATIVFSQDKVDEARRDEKVGAFLDSRRGTWMDMNVPESDGKLLYSLVIKNQYKRALEIGTSTGHSAIWIAWALSKTGGQLITIEIDEGRYRQALANFKAAGLSGYIDARLADAHDLVQELTGPFDFVFCDADKDWYKNYFIALYPKLAKGGCYAAHNVSGERGVPSWRSGTEAFYAYVKSLPDMETTVDNSGSGMSISYKKAIK
jgi:predicted O-methyltransferase YrrM